MTEICQRVFARVGLLGNPSDGYYGKCISFSINNFWAEVKLKPSEKITILPNPTHDVNEYSDLQQLKSHLDSCGYYGGVRILQAMVKRFYEWCLGHGVTLPHSNFTLSYDTNIPRQAGLSGSSAIACAALNCLLQHYSVAGQVPVVERPGLVLSAEQALGITAGLQDRVIQVYGGCVYMDFEEEYMNREGHGRYTPLDTSLLALGRPSEQLLHLIYCNNPSESGKVHANVRQRWQAGDPEVRAAMAEVAECARQGRAALERGDMAALGELMNRNFDLRRKMFGDEVLGEVNLAMVRTARSVGCAAKFTGSGGAVVALCIGGPEQLRQLQQRCKEQGFEVVPLHVAPAVHLQ
mmetsp:Transcript_38092/g.84864  ORF Transcript_38092/g.84864 Transcript_38092/m.84864 type:complete len:351 (+) Transcript_38092:88-1140(+)